MGPTPLALDPLYSRMYIKTVRGVDQETSEQDVEQPRCGANRIIRRKNQLKYKKKL